jgi:uncharacterized coiled-coil protein SlyX
MDERITDLELALTHLQKDYDALSEVVLQNGAKIKALEVAFNRLSERLESLGENSGDRYSAEDKPPHY